MSAPDKAERLSYALAKQMPDMAHGFSIQTGYGSITFEAGQGAERVRKIVESVLLRRRAVQP